MVKVSMLMALYNAEDYVEKSLVSMFEQTLPEVEFIVIDDGSTDRSLQLARQVAAGYPERNISIISRENRGIAFTRNQGVALASGEYLAFLDSDDWAEPTMLDRMYRQACASEAELLVCDYFLDSGHKEEYIEQSIVDTSSAALLGAMLTNRIEGFTWNKLIKRDFIDKHQLVFPCGLNMFEDFVFISRCMARAENMAYLDQAFVHYAKHNPHSVTSKLSVQSCHDIITAIQLIEADLAEQGRLALVQHELDIFKLNQRFMLLKADGFSLTSRYHALFNEANKSLVRAPISRYGKLLLTLSRYRLTWCSRSIFRLREAVRSLDRGI